MLIYVLWLRPFFKVGFRDMDCRLYPKPAGVCLPCLRYWFSSCTPFVSGVWGIRIGDFHSLFNCNSFQNSVLLAQLLLLGGPGGLSKQVENGDIYG